MSCFFFSSRRRHTRYWRDWSSDVCSSDLGTGASGLLRCPALERDPRLRSTVAAEKCARRLGPRRAFYTTPDSVADMEAIRNAVGARKLTLFGISYGTELALAYA